MSARKARLQLAAEARRDIRDIHLYGLEHWGEQQADTFHATLRRAFDTVRDHPQIEVARDDLMRGLRSLPVDHHVLYYRVTDDLIEVVRILHERADAARHLGTRRP